jgi:hypothetical protein
MHLHESVKWLCNVLIVHSRFCSGRDAWAHGNLQELGQLISESGRSSILNYECGMLHCYLYSCTRNTSPHVLHSVVLIVSLVPSFLLIVR